MRRSFGHQAETAGMPAVTRQMPITMWVVHHPGTTLNELARRLDMAKSQASKLVRGLERDGILRREGDPHDQRLVHLYPTDEGVRRSEEEHAAFRHLLTRTVSRLTEVEAEHLVEGLSALLRVCSDDSEWHGSERSAGARPSR